MDSGRLYLMQRFFSAFPGIWHANWPPARLVTTFCALFWCINGWAASYQEMQLADTLRDRLPAAQVQQLTSEDKPFLAIYKPSTLPTRAGGVLVLHNRQSNPDAPGLVHQLRTQLTNSGWDTLSLHLPADGTPVTGRILAGMDFFAQRETSPLVIIGHGTGAENALDFAVTNLSESLVGVVLISLDATSPNAAGLLGRLELPVLDLSGSRDLPGVIASTTERKRLVEQTAENTSLRQQVIEGADHEYRGLEQSAVAVTRGWLGQLLKNLPPPPATDQGN